MSISRRKFLRTGTLVAIAAGIPLKAALVASAQNRKPSGNDSPEPRLQTLSRDPLANYNQASFTSYVNSVFRLYTGSSTIDITLVQVKDEMPKGVKARGGAEAFSLLFRGGNKALEQGTYKLEHSSLGTFELFLVPGGADDNGAQSFVASINRVPYASIGTPPTRVWRPSTDAPKTPSKTVAPATVTPLPGPAAPATKTPEKKPTTKKGWLELD